jgi:hypothetical protein
MKIARALSSQENQLRPYRSQTQFSVVWQLEQFATQQPRGEKQHFDVFDLAGFGIEFKTNGNAI